MPEESTAATNGAETTASKKPASGKTPSAKKKRGAKKTATGKSKKNRAKRTAAKKATGNVKTVRTQKKKKPGRAPDKALRLLLLEQKHPEWVPKDFVREVPCVVNQVYAVRGKKRKYYERMLSELSDEQRAKLLAGPIVNKRTDRSVARAPQASAPRVPSAPEGAEIVFRRALRLVGLERARQLLGAFEREA